MKEYPQLNPSQPSVSALLQERNPVTFFCSFQYTWCLDRKKALVLSWKDVACSQKPLGASSARLGSEMRRHLCEARTKWEFSTWVKQDLSPSQSSAHSKPCSYPQHWILLLWLKKSKQGLCIHSDESCFRCSHMLLRHPDVNIIS